MTANLYSRLLERGRRIAWAVRRAHARAAGATVGHGCRIGPNCDLSPGLADQRTGAISLGAHCVLDDGVILHPHGGAILLGDSVYLGPSTVIYGHGGVTIGNDTLVSMHCRILSSNHSVPPPGTIIRSQPDLALPTRVGCDVWLGAGVTVLGGVTIGDGCVVGAGTVVTKDLPPGSIAVGVPARVIGPRK